MQSWILNIKPSSFIWAFSLFNALFFHGALIDYLSLNLALSSTLGLGVLLVLICISTILMWGVLGFSVLMSINLLKPLVILILIGNVIAIYFMQTYRVILDKTMMGNVLNTDRAEAFALFHPKLITFVVLALLLAGLLWRCIKWRAQPRWAQLAHAMTAIALVLGLVFINSASWLWVDKHAKVIGGLLLPWSYSLNTIRHWHEQKQASRQFDLLPALQWNNPDAATPEPITVVLVIGESARAKNFSLYGYERETTPHLLKQKLLVLRSAQACATYTSRALECILSHDPKASGLTHEILPNYLLRSGEVEVLWRTRNWGEPRLEPGLALRGKDLAPLCQAPQCLEPNQDEALLAGLAQTLQNASKNKQFIVLHQSGSHGPAYHTKYPAEFSKFEPACDTVDIVKCSQNSLVNAYDNSILYTDHLLNTLILMLEKQKNRRTVMIYISDHGESLGEDGWYLHGAPDMVAPKEQKEIPFLVWMSDSFIQSAKLDATRVNAAVEPMLGATAHGQHHIFHSVLGALGAQSPSYRADLDIFQTVRRP